MDFFDALKVLGRRWLVLLVGIILMSAAGGAALFLVPTNYQATGQLLLLLPPKASGVTTPTNPYLNVSPGMNITASLIASTLTNPETVRSVAEAGFSATYAVALTPGSGPLLAISAESTDPRMAVATRDEVIRRLDEELLRIQLEESVPQRQLIHARPNSVTTEAEPLSGSKIRVLAAIAGLGGVLTLLAAFVVDRFRPRSRHRGRGPAAPGWELPASDASPAPSGAAEQPGPAVDTARNGRPERLAGAATKGPG
jgi:hypothetical protein